MDTGQFYSNATPTTLTFSSLDQAFLDLLPPNPNNAQYKSSDAQQHFDSDVNSFLDGLNQQEQALYPQQLFDSLNGQNAGHPSNSYAAGPTQPAVDERSASHNTNEMMTDMGEAMKMPDDTFADLMMGSISSAGTPFSSEAFTRFRQDSQDFESLYSPFLIGQQQPQQGGIFQNRGADEDLLLTPLISPAMTPSADFQRMSINPPLPADSFTPLSSPALLPQMENGGFMGLPMSYAGGSSTFEMSGGSEFADAGPASRSNLNTSADTRNFILQNLNSPALQAMVRQLQTQLIGTSPSLQPVSEKELNSASATNDSRKDPMKRTNMPIAPARDRVKKTSLVSPYHVPQRRNSIKIASPALRPGMSGRTKSQSYSDHVESSNPPNSSTQSSAASAAPVAANTPIIPNKPITYSPSALTPIQPYFKEPFPVALPNFSNFTIQHAAAATLISPALTPQMNPTKESGSEPIVPITPAQLMRLDAISNTPNSHMTPTTSIPSYPLISPSLKPLLPNGSANMAAALRLTQKSNYQNIKEGNTQTIGLNYDGDVTSTVEARRDGHKQAEQRRRDSLKFCFEDLRRIMPPISEKNPSKVVVLRECCTYIKQMQQREQETEQLLASLKEELAAVKNPTTGQ
ncbi:hypothetical protein DFS34DRAFT_160193 [Phlyctochytrium arcticum]|nr:hypothetical protein DFS34DRAFT_160193 [Phlyctochytrium arcticum]